MGRSGPPARKGAPTTVRLEPELRDQLQKAATAAGRSMSEEICVRLAQSLSGEDILAAFDGVETYALCRLIAAALADLRFTVGHRWYEHPLAYRDARAAITELLTYFQPIGEVAVPEDHPAVVQLRRMGASDAVVAQVIDGIHRSSSGEQIGRLLIEEVETNARPRPEVGAAHDLTDIAGALRTLITRAGMRSEATAIEDGYQAQETEQGNEAWANLAKDGKL